MRYNVLSKGDDCLNYKHDLTGQKFGKLTALYPVKDKTHRARWHCVCECGNEKDVLQQNLSNGHVQSCGCLLSSSNSERITEYNRSIGRETHHETKTRLYRIWIGIKSRCLVETASGFKNYGGRGISICDEWKNSFLAFSEWAFANGYSDSLTIDRIDVNGDYSPDNCRWVSMSVQQLNKRLSSRNTSGVTGVSFNKKNNRWYAYIRKDGNHVHLGSFKTIDEATKARKQAEAQLKG